MKKVISLLLIVISTFGGCKKEKDTYPKLIAEDIVPGKWELIAVEYLSISNNQVINKHRIEASPGDYYEFAEKLTIVEQRGEIIYDYKLENGYIFVNSEPWHLYNMSPTQLHIYFQKYNTGKHIYLKK